MVIKSLIIDDDPFMQNLLQDKLAQFVPEVKVLGTAGSGKEGIELIHIHRPDLIFLDVEMGDMTGFDMLRRLDRIFFQTIFVTSYSHYAIKAIRFNALDYLVKPVDLEELKQAIKRYKSKTKLLSSPENVKQALENLQVKDPADQSLTLHLQNGVLRLPLKDIIRIEGERNYSFLYLTKKRKKLVSKTLGEFEELLSDKGFFRCHRSHLVNFFHVKSFPTGISVNLSGGFAVPVSRRKKEEFLKVFKKY